MSGMTSGVLAVVGVVVAFSLSSKLGKRAESPRVLIAFWRMVVVNVVWNLGARVHTDRRVTGRDVRQVARLSREGDQRASVGGYGSRAKGQ